MHLIDHHVAYSTQVAVARETPEEDARRAVEEARLPTHCRGEPHLISHHAANLGVALCLSN